MALETMRTSGVQAVFVSRPSERDVTELAEQFHLHPTHVEDLLASRPIEPDAYRDYIVVTWRIPVIERQRPAASMLTVFLRRDSLVMIEDGGCDEAHGSWVSVLRRHRQDTAAAADLLAEMLLPIMRDLTMTLAPAVPFLSDHQRQRVAEHLIKERSRVDAWLDLVAGKGWANDEAVDTFRLMKHYLFHLRQTLPETSKTVAAPLGAKLWPRALGGYAVTSLVLLILVLIAAHK